MATYVESTQGGFTHFGGLRSTAFTVASSGAQGGSTTMINKLQAYTVQFTEPDLSSGPANAESTFTVSGLSTNSALSFTPRLQMSTGYAISHVRCSTADELVIGFTNNSADTNSGSTNRGTLFEIGL